MIPINSLDISRKEDIERRRTFAMGSEKGMSCSKLFLSEVKMKPSSALSNGALGKGVVLFFMLLFMNYTPEKRPGKKIQIKALFF